MGQRYLVRLGDEVKEVEVEEGPAGLRVRVGSEWHEVRLEQVGRTSLYALMLGRRPHELFAVERADGFDIVIGSHRFPVEVGTRGRRPPPRPPETLHERPAETGGWLVLSPMMGAVANLYVGKGDPVAAGDILMIIEAMKMSNELLAQRAGTVAEVYVKEGQRVEQGSPLLLLI